MSQQPGSSPLTVIIMYSVLMLVIAYIYFWWVRRKYVPVVNLIRARQAFIANNNGVSPNPNPSTDWQKNNSYKTDDVKKTMSKDGKVIFNWNGSEKYYDTKGSLMYLLNVESNKIYEIFNSTYVRVAVINIADDSSIYFDKDGKLISSPPFYWSLSNIMSF